MMVIFISQCEKKALIKTRRVLDSFANRIGDRTWQTIITEEGLLAVKKLLKQTITKNSAIACHWVRSRIRNDLMWVVGNRQKFNNHGIVPVNSTLKNIQHNEWENDWHYLPIVKALTALAALLHDWGKATVLFQSKLASSTRLGDPLRHEWISCMLLQGLVEISGNRNTDHDWLKILIDGTLNESQLLAVLRVNKPLHNLPPIAQLLSWLIVTHHRLPDLKDETLRTDYSNQGISTLGKMLNNITAQWGYENRFEENEFKKRLEDCFRFKQGLLTNCTVWQKNVKKWTGRLLSLEAQIQQMMQNDVWRIVLHHARLCLMLGDHYYSSLPANSNWQSDLALYANTDKNKNFKQKLDEHLVGVADQALKVAQSLAHFSVNMDKANDIQSLKKKSPKQFAWQDIAVEKITAFKQENPTSKNYGWFIVNMASTGCGKTIANAKIMRALSEEGNSLRYILALGLRTLTLQTGDEYRTKIGLAEDELAVLIGSAAVQELHQQKDAPLEETNYEDLGSESMEQLLDEELEYTALSGADFLDAVLPPNKGKITEKSKAFLYKPVLVCTIDHIIAATETTRGGKYILPCLRLLSSDLVIDEVDDFDVQDLIAVGRLIHLAGMLGRKVMISSATIPAALAEGFFNAYQEGWQLYASFKNISTPLVCGWTDEFSTQIKLIDKTASVTFQQQYAEFHHQFICKRIEKIQKQVIKRKAYIVPCDDIYETQDLIQKSEAQSREQRYFAKIKQTALELHQTNHLLDEKTGKKLSFGVVRVANIPPCIELSKYLITSEWPENFHPKIMAYHSRQVLLLRSKQEKHLDAVLKRKETEYGLPPLNNSVIRQHLDNTRAENILFILVATPVEEVGRDHDLDWAIIEPSSYRSIIQLAGRVRRHRDDGIEEPNIAIMQYNLRALRKDGKPAYRRPGYEAAKPYRLETHNLCELVDEALLKHAITAIPRIFPANNLQPNNSLADLEHEVLKNTLTAYTGVGPSHLQGWLKECWWLTALPQRFNRFRQSTPDEQVYLLWEERKAVFYQKDEEGRFIKCGKKLNIQIEGISENHYPFIWLDRSYETALKEQLRLQSDMPITEEELQRKMREKSERYGELTIPKAEGKAFSYSDQFGALLISTT